MLSVLIPVYNWNPTDLVLKLRDQLSMEQIPFEIVISDDTPVATRPEYQDYLSSQSGIRCFHRNNPLSRSANRNFLADQAVYDHLLFIDCDAMIADDRFIKRYLDSMNSDRVVVGGTRYEDFPPTERKLYLRWKFGKHREEVPSAQRSLEPWKSFSTFNFLIPRLVFLQIRFDESIREYGHEDTLFGIRLKEMKIPVVHIDNPLFHMGLEEAEVFLGKVKDSVTNLALISSKPELSEKFTPLVKLLNTSVKLKRSGLSPMFRFIFRLFEKSILKNLSGRNPNLYLLDIYKLGLISQIA
jgi:glycosyltransferase involved in cell wall biosynthesis